MRPIYTNDFEELRAWCREYQRFSGSMLHDSARRFLIGMYQRHQARMWPRGNPARAQSFASGAMHFIMVAEELDICLAGPRDIRHISIDERIDGGHYANIIDETAQQLIYAAHSRGSNRESRYTPLKCAVLLSKLARAFLAEVRPDDRAQRIHDEMCIIARDIIVPI